MDSDERTYTKSEIRERRRELSQLLALQQRQLDALAKIDEGTRELDQVEREMAALARGAPERDQPVGADPRQPQMTGERALTILRDHEGTWLAARDVLNGMVHRGWEEDTEHAMQRLRHSLRRLALRNDHVKRDESTPTFRYRYEILDTDALIPVSRINGVAHPALQRGLSDG